MREKLPFWMIMAGRIWGDDQISHEDIKEIYRSFFKNQVLGAINKGDLPKPDAMVFSGGQESHFSVSEFLKDILEEEGIQSIKGFQDAPHCGVVRLSYPERHIYCQFD